MLIRWSLATWPGVRRAGLPRLSGAGAGPGAAQRRRLIGDLDLPEPNATIRHLTLQDGSPASGSTKSTVASVPPVSVDLSGEITAIATAVLAAFAIITAVFAVLAFLKQSREVRAIERQVTDQQELTQQQAELLRVQSGQLELQREQFADQLAERRRAQASCVVIWTETGPDPRRTDGQIEKGVPWREEITAHIRNTSAQPVYDLTVGWHRGTAPWGEPDQVPVLMPGEQEDLTRTFPDDLPATMDYSLFGAVARFRDAAAVHWRLRPDGQLDEEPVTE